MYVTIRNKNASTRSAAVGKQSSQREWVPVIGQKEPRSASRRGVDYKGREDSECENTGLIKARAESRFGYFNIIKQVRPMAGGFVCAPEGEMRKRDESASRAGMDLRHA